MAMKRLVAFFLSLVLMLGMGNFPAQEAVAEENSDLSEYVNILEELLDLVAEKGMDASALGSVASSAGKWAGSQIISIFFPDWQQSSTEKALAALSVQLDDMMDKIKDLSNMIVSTELTTFINNFTQQSSTPISIMEDAYNLLAQYEKKASEDSKYNPTHDRLNALTSSLGIKDYDDYQSLVNDFDRQMEQIYFLVTKSYQVTLESGTVKMTLLQIVEELMHRKYKWEHQAYPEWLTLQQQMVSAAFRALNLWQLSIAARMTKCKDLKKPIPKALITLEEKVNKYLENLNEVAKPLLVTKDTILPDSIRHYWYNGRSYYFYTALNTQNSPQELPYAGVSGDAIKYLQGLRKVVTSQTTTFEIVKSFWTPLVKYRMNGKSSDLVSAEVLENIWSDYGKKTSLLDIFFLKTEGGFNLPTGSYTSWNFIVDPVGKHAMKYAPHLFKADQVRAACFSVKGTPMQEKPSKGTGNSAAYKDESVILAYYHNSRVDSYQKTNLIGIGYIGTSLTAVHEENEIEWVTEKEVPTTGDEFNPIVWCLTGTFAVAIALLLLLHRRKKA